LVGIWVGNNDNSPMRQVASGTSGATPIWRRIMMLTIEKGYAAPEWQPPSGVEQVMVDQISGYPEHSGFPARSEYIIRGTLPSLPDPIHTKLKLCRGEMKLANDARVAAGDYDEKEFYVLREDDPVSRDGRNRWLEGISAWLQGRDEERYRPPTEYCGDQREIFVRLSRPENERNYKDENIEVHIDAESADGIQKIELWVNGALRETINDRRYRGKISLPAGQYELYAVAFSRSGEQRKSNTVKIGTGGQDWKQSPPSPSPVPSPSPAASPSPSPIVPPLPEI
jgi:membrane carboxypeptidase/penicillin-binding protein PbpC